METRSGRVQDGPREVTEYPLKGIFFAEFDNKRGSVLACQTKPECLETSDFKNISNFVITGAGMAHKLICVRVFGRYVMSFPLVLEHENYHRNAYLCAVGFVFDEHVELKQLVPYRTVLAKLGNVLESLEMGNCGFLSASAAIGRLLKPTAEPERKSSHRERTPSTRTGSGQLPPKVQVGRIDTDDEPPLAPKPIKRQSSAPFATHSQVTYVQTRQFGRICCLHSVLTCVLEQLNSHGECNINIDGSTHIYLFLFPYMEPPPQQVKPHHVPVRLIPIDDVMTEHWDYTLKRILPHINGRNSIFHISRMSSVRLPYTIECIKHLLYYRCVRLTDIFMFSNIYTTTDRIYMFMDSPHLQKAAMQCVRLQTSGDAERDDDGPSGPTEELPKPGAKGKITRPCENLDAIVLFRLYCELQACESARDFAIRNRLEERGIDPRKFFEFGVLNQLIRRVRVCPVGPLTAHSNEDDAPTEETSESKKTEQTEPEVPVLDGLQSLHEIACEQEEPVHFTFQRLAQRGDHVFVLK